MFKTRILLCSESENFMQVSQLKTAPRFHGDLSDFGHGVPLLRLVERLELTSFNRVNPQLC